MADKNSDSTAIRKAVSAVVEQGTNHKIAAGLIALVLGGGICSGVVFELHAPGVDIQVNTETMYGEDSD